MDTTSIAISSGGTGALLTLHPSDIAASGAGPFSTAGGGWPDVLDSNDGDTSYASTIAPGQFYVDMDDPVDFMKEPVDLERAILKSITIYVYAKCDDPANDIQVGYKTGTNTVWMPGTAIPDGPYTLIASTTYTDDPDGLPFDLMPDITDLQIAVNTLNPVGELFITEVYVEVDYTYVP